MSSVYLYTDRYRITVRKERKGVEYMKRKSTQMIIAVAAVLGAVDEFERTEREEA